MRNIILLYKNAYGGLSDAAWMLSLVMLINRAGSMVLPFLGIYLTNELNYGIREAGIVLAAYGLGAMAGSLLGGYLADKIGNFYVQFLSLLIGGLFLFALPFIIEFTYLLIAVFLSSLIVECLRPANTASVAVYSKPENITRSFSLNRMAVNLGFSVGPAVGGLLAAHSYQLLFFVDGISCILAGFLFFFYFRNKGEQRSIINSRDIETSKASPYKDLVFLFFVVLVMGFAVIFFQLFNTLPIFYREVHHLSEEAIGLLLGLNGLIVFLFEMILVNYLEPKVRIVRMVVMGTVLCGFSYVILNFAGGLFLIVIAMMALSFAEIMAMPFMVTYVIKRAGEGNRGSYIGLYSLAWASAFMIAPFLGTRIIAAFGFEDLWWGSGIFAVILALSFYGVLKKSS